ncbi:MAG: bifunctional adenosylcobinamide kinase/adenosylcobinamide-phosphate guanylyltransferase [Eubacteriales bacterium]|nr:bifunctional adenosylcobinamide kinase/adenosylcobinamide-phosphate guanylyltransferase [Eubacteriales bacterium]
MWSIGAMEMTETTELSNETERSGCLLIVGGSDSGKSAVAERFATEEAAQANCPAIYLATMRSDSAAAADKIRKHRSLRAGKGFVTIEQPMTESSVSWLSGRPVVLLEDLGNLVANELFATDMPSPQASSRQWQKHLEEAADRITAYCLNLAGQSRLIIVSNDVFRDGACFDTGTEGYKQVLAQIHIRLAKTAEVIEVTAGRVDHISAKARKC